MQSFTCGVAVVLGVCFQISTVVGLEDSNPIINISYGPIQGLMWTSEWTNETIYGFRGVPYASPPVGSLRFKDPIAPEKWTETKDCTSDQASCYQPSSIFSATLKSNENKLTSTPGMSEDCLYLNVYTPDLQPQVLMPVLFWIHGGAYLTGCANYSNYGPDFLVAEGVVVVTLNYRLGAFGLLTLGTREAPGNSQLKDQRLALLWVQQEIQKFGGDPSQVTIFGQSSGSASVHLHYLSPLSKDLFHRAIADSGPAIVSWAARDDGVWYGLATAEYANCPTSNMTETLECLLNLTADDLLAAQVQVPPSPEDDNKGWTLRYTPTVDPWSDDPFLPELPQLLIEKKSGSHVPILMGVIRDEGSIDVFGMDETEITNTTNNLDTYVPYETRSQLNSKGLKDIAKKLDKFYFNGTAPSYTNLDGFVKLNTDAWFMYLTVVSARYYRELTDVYLYYFTFDGSFKDPSTLELKAELDIDLVAHAEELNYMFVIADINQTAAADSNEVQTRNRMVRMWTNFVKYGVPANGTDPVLQNVNWLPVDMNSTRYMHIDVNLTMVLTDYLPERVSFWDNITTVSSATNLQISLLSLAFTAVLYFINLKD